ncbi:dihydroxyacetone kinase phosphotransfer subunit [Anaerosolibacter carboniphilus]|uniref:phosphoenolpyruvate--glycerone phosphotransferase n=1 Tax=Anaerosolibacter carboniphilus TaxID=1417629 RepID=A0A841KUP0_9FIRM|nr:dihydroxyacetone kinase phosphoryl donor subunit DhaM [Anaerosolibacter carboniphilus]MBB6217366.1 dihydroxyacetone kinase phosphotransfer subunit [Anaerosolibacter carboniphilus]
MIGIVIVSHSQKVAEGIKEIAEEMNNGSILIKAAGGVEENDGRIGTSTFKIREAIEEVSFKEIVLIFVDMGSAAMNAEMAVDMLDLKIKEKVRMVDAPLVEGVIAATIQATITDNLENIIITAMESRNLQKFDGCI